MLGDSMQANRELAGCRQLGAAWGGVRTWASLGVATRTVSVGLLVAWIVAQRVLRALGFARATPYFSQRAQDAVDKETRNWSRQSVEEHLAAIPVSGQKMEQWARDEAGIYMGQCRDRYGETWVVRALQRLPDDVVSIKPPVAQAVKTWAEDVMWALIETVPNTFLGRLDFPAAAHATDLLLQWINTERDRVVALFQTAEQQVQSLAQRRPELEGHAREVFGNIPVPTTVDDAGLWPRVWSRLSALLKAPDVPLPIADDTTQASRRNSAIQQTSEFITEFVHAAVCHEMLIQYHRYLGALASRLEECRRQLTEACETLDACHRLAEAELQSIETRGATLGQPATVVAAVTDMLEGGATEESLIKDWFRELDLREHPLDIRGKRPDYAHQRLHDLVANDASLLTWSRLKTEVVLARLPRDVLAGLIAGLVDESRKQFSYEQGLAEAPRLQTILMIPGGDHEESHLASLIRRHAMLRPGVRMEESPYDNTLVAVTEAHKLNLLQLPGVAHAYRAYRTLPALHDDDYDQIQAFADRRAHEAFCAVLVSLEARMETLILGLAFGKVLDTAAQPGRSKTAKKLIKLVPDDDIQTAFQRGRGQVLRSWDTLGTSVLETLETLACRPDVREQIQACVERAIAREGTPVVARKLQELKTTRRFRRDSELIRHLDSMLSREAPEHHAA